MDIGARGDFKTPRNVTSSSVSSTIDIVNASFDDKKLVSPDSLLDVPVNDLDTLLHILYSCVDSLSMAVEHVRIDAATSSEVVSEEITKVDFELSRLRDNLVADPGITLTPLQLAWDRVAFTKDALSQLRRKI